MIRRILQRGLAVVLLCLCSNISVIANDNFEQRLHADELLKKAIKHEERGESEKAVQLLNEAANVEGIGRMTATNIQMVLSSSLVSLGKYNDAACAYQKALYLAPDQAKADNIRLVAGELFSQMGNYKEGYEMLCKIETDSLFVRRDIQLARMLYGLRRYDEAIDLLKGAQQQNRNEYFSPSISQNIGFIYWAMGDLKSAEEHLNQALQSAQHKSDTEEYNIILENHAMVLSHQNRHTEAIDEMAKVVEFFSKRNSNNQTALRKYGEILTRAGLQDRALPHFKRYFREEQGMLIANLQQMTRQQKLNLWAKERPLLSKCFMLEDSAPEFLFEVAMFRRQISLLGKRDTDGLKRMLSTSTDQIKATLQPDEAAVEFIRYEDTSGEEWYAAIVLSQSGAKFLKLIKIDELYEPEVVCNNSIYNIIKREVQYEINLLYSNKALGDKIWSPIISALTPKARKVFFAPEGIFNMWGIENMPFSGKKRLELHRVSSIPSILERDVQKADFTAEQKLIIGGLDYNAALAETPASTAPNREARALLSTRTGGEKEFFKYLKFTHTEADAIADICKTAPNYKMGESSIKQTMGRYGFIHIATHGYSLNTAQPTELELLLDSGDKYDISLSACGLALSGANVSTDPQLEDGILSAREVCDLDLSGVSFVVLSACQTAKGDILDDGTTGIVRGLKNAGVKTILATLWSVDDEATLLFMQEFYGQLKRGFTPHEALQNAQKRVASKKGFNHPYYHSPFILIDAL